MRKTIKLILILTLLTIALALPAKETEKVTIDLNKSLLENAAINEVPIKSYIKNLGIDVNTDKNMFLNELDISKKEAEKAVKKFRKDKISFSWSIVVVGMLVVFVSLIVIGFIIAQLEHLHLFEKKKKKSSSNKTKKKKNTKFTAEKQSEENINSNAVVAAITALHMHILETEEENKLQLTFKRTPISMWKSSSKVRMPNAKHQSVRIRRSNK